MKVKTKIATVCILLFAALLALGTGLFVSSADSAVLSEVSYDKEYLPGDTFTVQDAKFTYLGQEYAAEKTITYPSGKRIARDSVVLAESGVYKVEYFASISGKSFKETLSFNVKGNAYSIDGSGEFYYGKNGYFTDLSNPDGLNVALGNDSVFKYNKVLDVSNLTYDVPIIKWYSTPNKTGSYEVNNVVIKLTDVYDPNNYVEVIYKYSYSNSPYYTYITAGANGKSQSGVKAVSEETDSTVRYKGKNYTNYLNTKFYGTLAQTSFNGVPFNDKIWVDRATFEDNYMWLSMDYAEKALYCQPQILKGYRDESRTEEINGYSRKLEDSIITDLDEECFFGEDTWSGFITGEVVLSISATKYEATNYNFFITELCGQDISDMTAGNSVAPTLKVDTLGFAENSLPDAIVGKSYKIFAATAYDDIEGNVDYKTFVYYNYNNSSKSVVTISDGAFIPKRAGEYTVVYSAEDSFGNKSVKTLTINAKKRDNVKCAFASHVTSAETGEVVEVADITFTNANAEFSYTVQAALRGSDVVYEIDKEELEFKPLYAGVYEIRYNYSDYCVNETLSYELTVNASNGIKFVDEPMLPRYLIQDCPYTFEDFYAYDFSNGTKQVKADITVVENGVTSVAYAGSYTAKTGTTFVDIKYKAGNAEYGRRIPVVDTGYGKIGKLNLANYLQGEAFTFAADNYGVTYSTDVSSATNGVAKLSLINVAYLIDDFSVVMATETEKANFEGIKLVFIKETDKSDTIEIVFTRQNDQTVRITVYRKGKPFAEVDSTCKFQSGDDNLLSVTRSGGKFVFGGSTQTVDISKLFDGFGNRFFIDVELFGVEGEACVKIKNMVNQTISNATRDTVKPTVIYDGLESVKRIGDCIKFGQVSCYDFVDPNAKASYYVKVDGSYAVAKDGTVLDGNSNSCEKEYEYACVNYGELEILITAEDYSGQKSKVEPIVRIVDDVAPALSVENPSATECKLNDKVKIAGYTAQDDNGEVEVTIVVVSPNGATAILTEETFTADKAGRYTIIYVAKDTSNNFTFSSYTVVCK